MLKNVFEKLNDPELVVQFQKLCGIERRFSPSEPLPADDEDHNRGIRYVEKKLLHNRFSTDDSHNGYLHARSGKSYHQRHPSDEHICEDGTTTGQLKGKDYEIRNTFFYYLFHIGAGLGNEMFYCCFFPYWFWNVDGYVCRRLVLTWCLIMYIGQVLKDIIRLPRPLSPPVIRMEKRYELEYGMPSTHAMIGLAFPTALLYFTINRYEYNSDIGIAIGIIWCLTVCLSRIYLGMHSVADVIAGIVLAILLMLVIIPALDLIDDFQLKHDYAPFVMFSITVGAALMYPSVDEWSSCRGDTTLILGLPSWSTCRGDTVATLGVQAGVSVASWLNYQSNFIPHNAVELVGPPPYHIKTPDLEFVKLALLRMVIGCSSFFLARAIMKKVTYKLSCWIWKLDPNDYERNKKLKVVEYPYKYLTYAAISMVVVYLAPLIFRYLDIERPTAWTEL